MKQFLKWFFIVIGSLVLLLLILGLTIFLRGQSSISAQYDVSSHTLDISTLDSTMLARGEHLAYISNCSGCHGDQFEGHIVVDDPAFGLFAAPNLTSGQGGVGGSYDVVEWERAIRHGVAKDGRAIAVMPSNYYANFSDADLVALVGYLRTLPPIDNTVPERSIGPIAKLLLGSGQYVLPAVSIEHSANHPDAPEVGPTVAYGEYLAQVTHCGDCHGADLTGQTMDGAPQGPNITKTGSPGNWNESEFFRTIRTGMTPDGRVLDPDLMPWNRLATLSDIELGAIWAFLQTL
jgi:cytochrome c553